jgi:hypothetical protein
MIEPDAVAIPASPAEVAIPPDSVDDRNRAVARPGSRK